MNTLPSLLHTLGTHGVRSIRFSLFEFSGDLRHTTPITDISPLGRRVRHVPPFSIGDLFAAFGLVPQTGEYLLNVDRGLFACLPANGRTAKPIERHAPPQKTSRRSAKDRAAQTDGLAA